MLRILLIICGVMQPCELGGEVSRSATITVHGENNESFSNSPNE